jgi:protein transport protein SEC31
VPPSQQAYGAPAQSATPQHYQTAPAQAPPQQAQYAAAPPSAHSAYGAQQPQQPQQAAYGQPQQPGAYQTTPPPAHFQPSMHSPMQPMQPAVAAAPVQAPAPPPAPVMPKPPANLSMHNVETDKVSPSHASIVKSLTTLFKVCEGAAGANPARKKEVEDSSKRVAGLLWKLNRADVSPSVCEKLTQLCAALDGGDVATASQVQVALTTHDWDEASSWLSGLKRLLKMRSSIQ